jgi:hypothetical protein
MSIIQTRWAVHSAIVEKTHCVPPDIVILHWYTDVVSLVL